MQWHRNDTGLQSIKEIWFIQSSNCRELDAFVFVFETANRIVVEEPKFSHATYFFEIEEPLAICCQASSLPARMTVLRKE